jgi:16S rRNA (guanine527-N7)-methyltransferase
MEVIKKYFPEINQQKLDLFSQLLPLYHEWNSKINVISRKDMENFYINHVLHSLAVAKVIHFTPGTQILDVGTGGGFPGIPLAILFPECSFHLLDSIEKKIKVVKEVTESLQLKNVTPIRQRAEEINQKFDFIISRAVTALPAFVGWVGNKILTGQRNPLANGIIYLKGGDFSDELRQLKLQYKLHNISEFFEEEFFETKKIVHLYKS